MFLYFGPPSPVDGRVRDRELSGSPSGSVPPSPLSFH